MSAIKAKIITLDEQIKWLESTQKLIEANGDVNIVMQENITDILRDIRENLLTTKMWIKLPHFHQAALMVLDGAFEQEDKFKTEGRKFERSFELLTHLLGKLRNLDNAGTDEEDQERLLTVAYISLYGVGKFIVNKEKGVGNG